MSNKSIIRVLNEAELFAFNKIAMNAFPRIGGYTDEDVKDYIKKYLEQVDKGIPVTTYGLFRKDTLFGGMKFYDFKLNLHDTPVLMGGLGGVSVDMLHKKEGVAKEMLQYFIEHYDLKGACLVSLYSFRLDFYRKMGFGFGTKTSLYQISPANIIKQPSKANLRFLTKEDFPLIRACFNRYARRNHGMLIHDSIWWESKLFPKGSYNIGYFENGQLKGYVNFEFTKSEGKIYDQDILVYHFVYENRTAFSELLSFLRTQFDQANYINLMTQDEDFYFNLNNPYNGQKSLVPLHHQSNVEEVGISYRIINVARFFEQMKERNFGDATLTLKITIEDSFYPQNTGSTIVQFEDGNATVLSESENIDATISLGIAEFSSLVMGVIGFKKLYDYGLAEVTNKMYILTLDKLFASPKPICLTWF